MKWYKVGNCMWVSEREINQEHSRIREHQGKYYASGQVMIGDHNQQVVQRIFDNLKEAKKWVQEETGAHD